MHSCHLTHQACTACFLHLPCWLNYKAIESPASSTKLHQCWSISVSGSTREQDSLHTGECHLHVSGSVQILHNKHDVCLAADAIQTASAMVHPCSVLQLNAAFGSKGCVCPIGLLVASKVHFCLIVCAPHDALSDSSECIVLTSCATLHV